MGAIEITSIEKVSIENQCVPFECIKTPGPA